MSHWPKYAAVGLWLTLSCGQEAKLGKLPADGASDVAGVGGNGADGTSEGGTSGRSTGGANQGGRAGGPSGGAESEAGAAGAEGNGSCVPITKRLVRLSFAQLSTTIRALFGDAFGDQIDLEYSIGTRALSARTFPPLASTSEGSTIIPAIWQECTQIAADAGKYAAANLATLSECGDSPTDTCARDFVASFAERVFRRPPTSEELASFLQVYDEVTALPASTTEALGSTVEALLQSPQFLYRTEFGDDPLQAGELLPFELASELSYFLSDGPPDAALLAAAAQGTLTSSDELAAQATRILETPEARNNLEWAMESYFGLDNLELVVKEDPAFTSKVRDSAYRETQQLIAGTLWARPFTDILTSRRGSVSTSLASLYGVSLPAPVPNDESVLVDVELPPERAGLLTRTAFLALSARPDIDSDSVVGRGLRVNATLLCQTLPPIPTDPNIRDIQSLPATAPPRERAQYRASQELCRDCHALFDPYGLALDAYDNIGRYRTMDSLGRPIDPGVTLPAVLGSASAANAVDMEAQIAKSPAFARCLSKNMLLWANAEGLDITPQSCAVAPLAAAFTGSNASFSALLREIAISPAFRERQAGTGQ